MAPLTPLLRPDRYFAERDLDGYRVLAIVVVLVLVGPATVYATGWILTTHVDGTTMVDNPERPPDWVCEDDSDVFDQSGCDQPREVERDVDSVIWSVMNEFVGPALLAGPLTWLVIGVSLHAGSWLAGGDHGAVPSFAVAAWGLVPVLVAILLRLVAIHVTLDPVTVTPGDEAAAIESAVAQIETLHPVTTATMLPTAVWGAVIWRYGLEHERGLDGAAAWTVAGLVAGFLVVTALV